MTIKLQICVTTLAGYISLLSLANQCELRVQCTSSVLLLKFPIFQTAPLVAIVLSIQPQSGYLPVWNAVWWVLLCAYLQMTFWLQHAWLGPPTTINNTKHSTKQTNKQTNTFIRTFKSRSLHLASIYLSAVIRCKALLNDKPVNSK